MVLLQVSRTVICGVTLEPIGKQTVVMLYI